MSSIQYDTETGITYTMINGVPHKLVTENIGIEGGFKVVTKLVPAVRRTHKDTNLVSEGE